MCHQSLNPKRDKHAALSVGIKEHDRVTEPVSPMQRLLSSFISNNERPSFCSSSVSKVIKKENVKRMTSGVLEDLLEDH
jgi:hypothetical protein